MEAKKWLREPYILTFQGSNSFVTSRATVDLPRQIGYEGACIALGFCGLALLQLFRPHTVSMSPIELSADALEQKAERVTAPQRPRSLDLPQTTRPLQMEWGYMTSVVGLHLLSLLTL